MLICFARVLGLAASLFVVVALAAPPWALAKVQAISRIDVEEEGGTTRIILRGAEDPIFTAFKLREPPRLLVDLPDVVFEGLATSIPVQNGLVGDITLGAFGDPRVAPSMARVSVSLLAEAEYEVEPNGDEVVISIRPKGGSHTSKAAQKPSASTPEAAGKAPAPRASRRHNRERSATKRPARPSEAKASAHAKTESSKPKAEGPKAISQAASKSHKVVKRKADLRGGSASGSRITQVVPGDGWIDVHAKGPIDNVDAFVIHGPERLVVDFWGTVNAKAPSTIPVGRPPIERIRLGQHSDKVRLVVDLKGELRSHNVELTKNGVRIHLNGNSKSASAKAKPPAAPGETAEDRGPKGRLDQPAAKPRPKRSGGPARVTSVHFESYEKADRIVVSLDGHVQPIVAEPDSSTIVVDLPGARIAPEVERRVNTREFGGPVEILSAFQTPDVDRDQVRIVLKRHGSATPKLRWEGQVLLIEIERFGSPAALSRSATGGESAGVTGTPPGPGVPGALSAAHGAPIRTVPAQFSIEGDDLYAGPSEPASIDILEEGGFDEDKPYQGQKISLDFKGAEIGNILRLIADVSDLNIIAGEEVKGTVTIRLVEVPWDQALDVVLMTKGLGFLRIGKVLRIAPIEILKQEEEARLQERRAREKLEDLIVKLQPVSYADVKGMEKLVKKLLSPRGTVNVDTRTNTLIIKDIPSVINEATALVKAIDTQTPQVLIETKIVEATLNFSRDLGAVFGFGYNAAGATGSTWQGGAPDFRLGDGSRTQVPGFGTSTQRSNFLVSNPISAATGLLTMGLLGLNDHLQLDLQLQAAEANSKLKVISSPRVVTLDNRSAKILQGTAIRFDASDGDSVSTSFVDAVLELNVTPHITADRTIVMKIKVSRNAPRTDTATGQDTGINKNEAETELLVFDGQTVVLGGIYVVEKSEGGSKVPFLADIPLIGTAFKSSNLFDERRELLIFVTPTIVRGMKPAY